MFQNSRPIFQRKVERLFHSDLFRRVVHARKFRQRLEKRLNRQFQPRRKAEKRRSVQERTSNRPQLVAKGKCVVGDQLSAILHGRRRHFAHLWRKKRCLRRDGNVRSRHFERQRPQKKNKKSLFGQTRSFKSEHLSKSNQTVGIFS